MRRALAFVAMFLCAAAGSAVEVGGAFIPDTAKLAAGGQELLLNGAGERWLLLFKIYAIGLYLPARRNTLEGVLALQGPKRIFLVVQHNELSASQIHEHLFARISDGSQPEVAAVLKSRLEDLDRIIFAEGSIKRGGTISLDYLPALGTVIRVNGEAKGAPIPGQDFYNALLQIWLGEGAKSKTLRDALLGRGGS